MSKKLKIKESVLSDGVIIKTIYFKNHSREVLEVKKYLNSINAIIICHTFLENDNCYIDYYVKKL